MYDSETILNDDYPVNWDYLYLADGKVIRSDIKGTVKDLKHDLGAVEIRRCDIHKRIEKEANDAKE